MVGPSLESKTVKTNDGAWLSQLRLTIQAAKQLIQPISVKTVGGAAIIPRSTSMWPTQQVLIQDVRDLSAQLVESGHRIALCAVNRCEFGDLPALHPLSIILLINVAWPRRLCNSKPLTSSSLALLLDLHTIMGSIADGVTPSCVLLVPPLIVLVQ